MYSVYIHVMTSIERTHARNYKLTLDKLNYTFKWYNFSANEIDRSKRGRKRWKKAFHVTIDEFSNTQQTNLQGIGNEQVHR